MPFCIIGGLAAIRWGEPRTTRDVDLCVFTDFEADEEATDYLISNLSARIVGVREFALSRRVLLLRASNGVDIDVSLGGLPFERRMMERATPYRFANMPMPFASAEDIVIMKVTAARPRDWNDIEGILRRQGRKLDVNYILDNLEDFAAVLESNEPLTMLKDLLKREMPTK